MEKVIQVPANPQKPVPPASVLRRFETPKRDRSKALIVLFAVVVIFAGIGSGWVLARQGGSGTPGSNRIATDESKTTDATEAGTNGATYNETAEGILRDGGIDGEGTHHLERDGGPQQNVYLTSSLIDLDGFVDEKVQVWGMSNAGQSAGWLMDVGKIKVIE